MTDILALFLPVAVIVTVYVVADTIADMLLGWLGLLPGDD